MLQTALILLIALWFIGVLTANTMGGLIHVALVVAVVMLVANLVRRRKVV